MHTPPIPRRAIVIGASMAGLLAARVLSESFDEVVLIERDRLPEGAELRKGTPHAAHAHGLLARGLQILESLLPGFTEAAVAKGAVRGDIGGTASLQANGRRFARQALGVAGLAASRALIESELRRRVKALAGLRWLEETDLLAPVFDAAAARVTGVQLQRRVEGAPVETLAADLVLDCSGRGSRAPQWLRDWGFDAPAEERVTIQMAYATAYFRRDAAQRDDLPVRICAATPELPRPGVLLAQEPAGDGPARWVVTLGGYGADAAPPTPEGLLQRARETMCPAIVALVERGQRLGPVQRYAFPHSQWRHYERLRRFPGGFLVMGDAMASFNPIYGQGMTVAACEAMALRAALSRHQDAGLWRPFFRACASVVATPWQLAVGADLALPMVEGPRPLPVRLVNAYIARLFRAAEHDAEVAGAFIRVMHLLAAPPSLFAPGIVWRVWRGGRDRPRPLHDPVEAGA